MGPLFRFQLAICSRALLPLLLICFSTVAVFSVVRIEKPSMISYVILSWSVCYMAIVSCYFLNTMNGSIWQFPYKKKNILQCYLVILFLISLLCALFESFYIDMLPWLSGVNQSLIFFLSWTIKLHAIFFSILIIPYMRISFLIYCYGAFVGGIIVFSFAMKHWNFYEYFLNYYGILFITPFPLLYLCFRVFDNLENSPPAETQGRFWDRLPRFSFKGPLRPILSMWRMTYLHLNVQTLPAYMIFLFVFMPEGTYALFFFLHACFLSMIPLTGWRKLIHTPISRRKAFKVLFYPAFTLLAVLSIMNGVFHTKIISLKDFNFPFSLERTPGQPGEINKKEKESASQKNEIEINREQEYQIKWYAALIPYQFSHSAESKMEYLEDHYFLKEQQPQDLLVKKIRNFLSHSYRVDVSESFILKNLKIKENKLDYENIVAFQKKLSERVIKSETLRYCSNVALIFIFYLIFFLVYLKMSTRFRSADKLHIAWFSVATPALFSTYFIVAFDLLSAKYFLSQFFRPFYIFVNASPFPAFLMAVFSSIVLVKMIENVFQKIDLTALPDTNKQRVQMKQAFGFRK